MSYRVLIHAKAEKEFSNLPKQAQSRLKDKILALENNPRPPGSKKMEDREDYRLRTGDYRAIYSIDDAGHRKDVYR